MKGQLIGKVEKGDTFVFTVSNRSDTGVSTGFTPEFFDVIDPTTDNLLINEGALTQISTSTGVTWDLWRGSIDTSLTDFQTGRLYALVIKESGTLLPPTAFQLYNFYVEAPLDNRTDLAIRRLDYLRNDIENVMFPRLRRILTNSGENTRIDLFTYDDAGNILSFRVRHFDSKVNAEASTNDIADTALPQEGEIATYRVSQTWQQPRKLRTDHLSTPDVDAVDFPADENTATAQNLAPGNEGGWPT